MELRTYYMELETELGLEIEIGYPERNIHLSTYTHGKTPFGFETR